MKYLKKQGCRDVQKHPYCHLLNESIIFFSQLEGLGQASLFREA